MDTEVSREKGGVCNGQGRGAGFPSVAGKDLELEGDLEGDGQGDGKVHLQDKSTCMGGKWNKLLLFITAQFHNKGTYCHTLGFCVASWN